MVLSSSSGNYSIMNIKTMVGSIVGVAIALMIGAILLDRLDQVYSTESPQPISFMLLLSGVGGIVGGAIASPVPEVSDE